MDEGEAQQRQGRRKIGEEGGKAKKQAGRRDGEGFRGPQGASEHPRTGQLAERRCGRHKEQQPRRCGGPRQKREQDPIGK